jgi:hypothetical protein
MPLQAGVVGELCLRHAGDDAVDLICSPPTAKQAQGLG